MAKNELDFHVVRGKIYCSVYYNAINKHTDYSEKMSINASQKMLEKIDNLSNPRFVENNLIFDLPLEQAEVVLFNYKDFKKMECFNKLFRKVNTIKYKETMPKKAKVQRTNKYAKKATVLLMTAIVGFSGMAMVHAYNGETKKDVIVDTNVEQQENNYYVNDSHIEDNKEVIAQQINDSKETTKIINTNDRSSTPKAQTAKEDYEEIINNYCNKYGLCTDVLLAIATQERGVHSNVRDSGGAIGLMQIEVGVWNNESINVYNVLTKENEKLNITENKLGNLDFNIKTACAIFQNYYEAMDHNLFATIQCYNMGLGNMNKILNTYAKENGITKEEVLENKDDLGWLNDRYLIDVGDKEYLEHVLSYANLDSISKYYNISQNTFTEINGVKTVKA